MSLVIIAHDIRSLHNVGAIFRSAAAFGVEKMYLTGYTATPPRKEIAKVALGAERMVPWEAGEVGMVIESLHGAGYSIIALETTEDAQDLRKMLPARRTALVLGNEVSGLSSEVLALCDGVYVIPMHAKRSLNVSVATGIALFALTRL